MRTAARLTPRGKRRFCDMQEAAKPMLRDLEPAGPPTAQDQAPDAPPFPGMCRCRYPLCTRPWHPRYYTLPAGVCFDCGLVLGIVGRDGRREEGENRQTERRSLTF